MTMGEQAETQQQYDDQYLHSNQSHSIKSNSLSDFMVNVSGRACLMGLDNILKTTGLVVTKQAESPGVPMH